jgi:hypothetical protein
MKRSMLRTVGWGALFGAILETAIVAVLAILALQLNPPGGIAEARTWFGLYAIVWSLPSSLALEWLLPTVRSRGMAVVLLVHWALVGAAGSLMVAWIRHRRESGK